MKAWVMNGEQIEGFRIVSKVVNRSFQMADLSILATNQKPLGSSDQVILLLSCLLARYGLNGHTA